MCTPVKYCSASEYEQPFRGMPVIMISSYAAGFKRGNMEVVHHPFMAPKPLHGIDNPASLIRAGVS